MTILFKIFEIGFMLAGSVVVLAFWALLGTLVVSVIMALFTASMSTFGVVFGILMGILAIIYLIGMIAVI